MTVTSGRLCSLQTRENKRAIKVPGCDHDYNHYCRDGHIPKGLYLPEYGNSVVAVT